MRITKRQLKQIIREEAARLEGKRPISEAYDMPNANRAESLYADTAVVAEIRRQVEDLHAGIFNDAFDDIGDDDEAADMADAATVLVIADALDNIGLSAAEVLYDHLRRAGRR